MSTFVTQIAVVSTEARSRRNVLNGQIGFSTEDVASARRLMKTGDTITGNADQALVLYMPSEVTRLRVTLTKGGSSLVFDNVYGIFHIPAAVDYTVEYPLLVGSEDAPVTIITA